MQQNHENFMALAKYTAQLSDRNFECTITTIGENHVAIEFIERESPNGTVCFWDSYYTDIRDFSQDDLMSLAMMAPKNAKIKELMLKVIAAHSKENVTEQDS